MNCFEWQNHAADFIDGRLPAPEADDARKHLDGCGDCQLRHTRFRTIVDTLRTQPRSPLPEAVRRAPLATPLPRLDLSGGRSRWQGLPWYVRTSVEGLAVASTVLLVVAMVPKMRALYEQSIERKIEALLLAEPGLEDGVNPAAVPLTRGRKAAPAGEVADDFSGSEEEDSAHPGDAESAEGESTLASSDSPEPAGAANAAAGASAIRVGNSEIWRFHLKSDSPRDFRARIVTVLTEAGVPTATPGFGGVEAPGGIQFDLEVSKEFVGPLKVALEKLTSPAPGSEVDTNPASPRTRPFTWYKNRSRRQIAGGKARVVIWLSQY